MHNTQRLRIVEAMKGTELRKLDAWIAEHVMGWRLVKDTGKMRKENDFIVHGYVLRFQGAGLSLFSFAPTIDPADAMMVLQKCALKVPGRIHIYPPQGGCENWMLSDCEAHRENQHSALAKTLPFSICLFAKKLFPK